MLLTEEYIKGFDAITRVLPSRGGRCKRAPTERGMLTSDATTVDIEGAWKWGTIVYRDRPLVADLRRG